MSASATWISSRASTTFSMRPVRIISMASLTALRHCAGVSAPSRASTPVGASAGVTSGRRSLVRLIVVSHARPPRRPTTISGTTSAEPSSEELRKLNEPNATSPLPGRATSSSTSAAATSASHHDSASANRSSPLVAIDAARPHATRPSPRRTHDITSSAGRPAGTSETRSPGSASSWVRTRRCGVRAASAGDGERLTRHQPNPVPRTARWREAPPSATRDDAPRACSFR